MAAFAAILLFMISKSQGFQSITELADANHLHAIQRLFRRIAMRHYGTTEAMLGGFA
jgi:hypothetical protein